MSERGDQDWWVGGEQGRRPEREAWSPTPNRGPEAGRGYGGPQEAGQGGDPRVVGRGYAPPRGPEQGDDDWRPRSRSQAQRSASTAGRREQTGYPQAAAGPTSRFGPGTRPRQPAYVVPLLLIVVPLLGALVSGSGLGIVFTLACVAAALGATWLCSVPGLWWVVPSTPIALLGVALLWATFDGLSSAKTTVAAATSVFDGIAGAFPGIAAATLAALIVTVVRVRQGVIGRKVKRV